MIFPTITELSEEIWGYVRQLRTWGICKGKNDDDYGECRLQVMPDGGWYFRTGDSQYDTDHRGYWGNASVSTQTTKSECREIARQLIEDAREQRAIMGEDEE